MARLFFERDGRERPALRLLLIILFFLGGGCIGVIAGFTIAVLLSQNSIAAIAGGSDGAEFLGFVSILAACSGAFLGAIAGLLMAFKLLSQIDSTSRNDP